MTNIKKQNRVNITFRENDKEKELYIWVKENGEIGGVSNFIKNILNEKMKSEKNK